MAENELLVEKLLENIAGFWNAIQSGDGEKAVSISEEIVTYFCALEEKQVDYYSLFDTIFADATDMYLVSLSVLFYLFGDVRMLNKAEELLLKGDLDFSVTIALHQCFTYQRFVDNTLEAEYSWKRKIHYGLLERYKQVLSYDIKHIPVEERVKNRIILMTNTLLEDSHAPTQMVLDTYCMLRYKLGCDVRLLVVVENATEAAIGEYWLQPRIGRCLEYDKEFFRTYKEMQVKGEQILLNKNNLNAIRSMLDDVYEWKPEGIWFVGGESLTVDVLSEMVTTAVRPCTMGYAVSEAQILIGEEQENSECRQLMQEFVRESGQELVHMQYARKYESMKQEYKAADYGCSEDEFLIAIVGNRLDEEINDVFINLLEKIVDREADCRFIIIGKFEKNITSEKLESRMKRIGYCENLTDVLRGTDLFLNTIRIGGGISALMSIYAEVPVITLEGGDVASVVGEAFICDSIENIPQLVSKYYHDHAFYQNQVAECKKVRLLYDVDDSAEYSKVLDAIRGREK